MNDLATAVVTIVGWAGALVSLVTYIMVTGGRISPSTVRYQVLNITGAATLGLSALVNGALPSAVVNIIWIVIGVFAVVSMKRHAILSRLATHVRRQRALAATRRARLAACRTLLAHHTRLVARRSPLAPDRGHLARNGAGQLRTRALQPGSSRPAGRSASLNRRARSTSRAA
ncbi:hypothetical protein [Georgenia sp. SYP-B2076]|uniref:CBU_0592 family membrane protein n=1 Tax=Georgenia sp. SYP-B2076 TaxID=2495881 RepID=UPI000F8E7F2C|nr:hypothetical protein [Georgenia sp. SYP-B2076]